VKEPRTHVRGLLPIPDLLNAAAPVGYIGRTRPMPTFSFTFAAALFALPLAGVPVLLHLLFRQKSPVVMFSTLRFVKRSVQRTAARRRLQKWLLLACRALLIALLVWAVAQPVKRLTGGWLGSHAGGSAVAAIVVDTSYSMQLQDGTTPLLAKADAAVQDLLRGPLAGAKVAVFTSRPAPPGQPEGLRDASAVLADWSPLRPQAAVGPLVDRTAAAVALLDRQPPGPRWLVVVSDFQSCEFPRPVPQAKDARTVLLDLRPADAATARSAGVTKITVTPQPPIAGLPAEVAVEVTGPPGDSRAVRLRTATAEGSPVSSDVAPAMATLDATGRGTVRFPVALPAERFIALTADLTADDAMPWDNTRTQLVEVPPRQKVAFIQQVGGSPGERFVKLALDPSEGALAQWPLMVHTAVVPAGDDDVAVAVLARWPGPHTAAVLRSFAAAGHTVVLFLTPGLETSWAALPAAERDDLSAVLPSAPAGHAGDVPRRAVVADGADPLLVGLTDEKFELGKIIVRRMVPLTADGDATAILTAAPVDPSPDVRTQGLLFRKPVGRGSCYTFATTPDPATTNLGTHPTFLPLVVRTALRPPDRSAAQNVELGHAISIDPVLIPATAKALQVTGPQGEQYQVNRANGGFTFDAIEPGPYAWRRPTDAATAPPLAWSNVQLPAAESELTYRPAATVAPADPATVVAASVAELSAKVDQLAAPEPQWQWPLAIVMFLLCLEALMGSWPRAWSMPRALRRRPAAAAGPSAQT
jgi:hypothetical protein